MQQAPLTCVSVHIAERNRLQIGFVEEVVNSVQYGSTLPGDESLICPEFVLRKNFRNSPQIQLNMHSIYGVTDFTSCIETLVRYNNNNLFYYRWYYHFQWHVHVLDLQLYMYTVNRYRCVLKVSIVVLGETTV